MYPRPIESLVFHLMNERYEIGAMHIGICLIKSKIKNQRTSFNLIGKEEKEIHATSAKTCKRPEAHQRKINSYAEMFINLRWPLLDFPTYDGSSYQSRQQVGNLHRGHQGDYVRPRQN